MSDTRDNTLVLDAFHEYDGSVQVKRQLLSVMGLVGTILEDRSIQRPGEMIFRFRGKDVSGESAIEIVRALELEEKDYMSSGGPIRQYLMWSLNRLSGSVPPRDLDLSDRLDDETLALGYLLLLDEFGIGQLKNNNDR